MSFAGRDPPGSSVCSIVCVRVIQLCEYTSDKSCRATILKTHAQTLAGVCVFTSTNKKSTTCLLHQLKQHPAKSRPVILKLASLFSSRLSSFHLHTSTFVHFRSAHFAGSGRLWSVLLLLFVGKCVCVFCGRTRVLLRSDTTSVVLNLFY